MGLYAAIVYGLTWLYTRLQFGPITNVSEYHAHGETARVYWIEDKDNPMGHTTLINTILLNKTVLDDYSKVANDYIFLHELGHVSRPLFARLIFYLLALPSGLLAVAAITLFPTLVIQAAKAPSWNIAIVHLITTSVLAVVPVIIFSLVNKAEELAADLYAIDRLGRVQYKDARDEISPRSRTSRIRHILNRIIYPNPSTVVWVYAKLNSEYSGQSNNSAP